MKKTKKYGRFGFLARTVCTSALVFSLMSGCVFAETVEMSVPELLEPVGVELDTATAYIGEIADTQVFEGSVRPYVEELYFTLNGNVDEVFAVVGQQVKAGDVLVTLDQEAEEERMEALRGDIEEHKTNAAFDEQLEEIRLMMLETELEHLRSTGAGTDAIRLKELDIEEEKVNQALSRELRDMKLAVLEEELEKLEADAQGRVLTAPFDGVVMYGMMMEKGTYINAYNPVIYLADDTQLSVSSEYISEMDAKFAHDLYALIADKRYEITPKPFNTEEFVAMVLSGEKLTTEFTFDEPDEALHAGQYAAVCMVKKYKSDALLVPTNALYHDAAGRYVYVVEDDERVRVPVKVGISTDWLVEITEGIEEGAVVYVKE